MVNGDRRTPCIAWLLFRPASNSTVLVASTRTHAAACGALKALWTMASAIDRSTPLTGMRSSFAPVAHGSSSRPAKREVVEGPAMGERAVGPALAGAPAPCKTRSTSSRVTRPSRPEPAIAVMSRPCCFA